MVTTLAEVHGNQKEVMDSIKERTTSCQIWGQALESLFIGGSPDVIYIRQPNKAVGPEIFKKIEESLRANKAVLLEVWIPGNINHVFTIAGDKGKARILHAWQDAHRLRAEKGMPIGMTVDLLKELTSLSYNNPSDIARLETVRGILWGGDHKERGAAKSTICFKSILTGTPKEALNEANQTLAKLSIALEELSNGSISPSGRSTFYSMSSESSHSHTSGRTTFCSANSEPPGRISSISSQSSEGPCLSFEPTHGAGKASRSTVISSVSKLSTVAEASHACAASKASHISQASIDRSHTTTSIRNATGVGAGLGLVLGAGGALLQHSYWSEVIEEGFKSAIGMGAAEAAAAAVTKSVTPTFSKLGTSVFRANAAAGVALFGVFAIWDVAKWSKHDITAVQLRQNLAAGAAGGIIGGGAGIFGGFGGAAAGKAIDEPIWDESEDSVMNSYEFFGWHDVSRNTRPIFPTEEIVQAYMGKLDGKPSKLSEADWETVCTANVMILLKAMFNPEFKELLNLATDFRNASSKGVQIIGTIMLNSMLSAEADLETSERELLLFQN